MRRVVLTGGPGVGKTTLLAELALLGFPTVSESAREVIAERLARGESPRPDPEAFAREILRRDREKYLAQLGSAELVFFDRSPLEALAMVHEAAPLSQAELMAKLSEFSFHKTVFVLPPWRAIYRTDAERDHPFSHVEHVHSQLVGWYRRCGYTVHEVPRVAVKQRAAHVLQVLGRSDA
jgi:predicted ATPase